jgi:hypothetical protein
MMKKEVEWDIDLGQTVRVYRNLINGLISVQHNIKGRGWILSGHCDNCVIVNVSFQVSEPGRQRVLLKRKRNVHAYATGRLISADPTDIYAPVKVGYDPYKYGFFFNKETGGKISKADCLIVRNNEVYVRIAKEAHPVTEFKQIALDLFNLKGSENFALLCGAA